MFDEEDLPAKKHVGLMPLNLERLSVDELAQYINELKDEILRTESEITRKKAANDAAASFFKS